MVRMALFTSSLIALSVGLGLVLCELVLRLFFPSNLYSFEQHLFSNSEAYGYYLTPRHQGVHSQPDYTYTIQSNSRGFRGAEANFDAAYRVLVLGDSFGMGQGVGEGKNLCDLANQHFARQGLDIGVFNTSVSGYSGVNEVAVLRELAGEYEPDTVILLFYWNDVGMTQSLHVQNGYLVLNPISPMREWLNNNSELYCLFKKFYYAHFKQADNVAAGALRDDGLAVSRDQIAQMARLAEGAGADFHVVLLPLRGIFQGPEAFREGKEKFKGMLADAAIDYVDWSEKLPQDPSGMVFHFDHHWNESGHQYFSQFLREIIVASRTERLSAAE